MFEQLLLLRSADLRDGDRAVLDSIEEGLAPERTS
jgi:hypothetical protein